jgi:hypothetical protein
MALTPRESAHQARPAAIPVPRPDARLDPSHTSVPERRTEPTPSVVEAWDTPSAGRRRPTGRLLDASPGDLWYV